jgi:hypothetical protein
VRGSCEQAAAFELLGVFHPLLLLGNPNGTHCVVKVDRCGIVVLRSECLSGALGSFVCKFVTFRSYVGKDKGNCHMPASFREAFQVKPDVIGSGAGSCEGSE